MSLLKKLAGQTAIYGLSSIVGRLLNYLLVPLYTRVFDPGEYGVVTQLFALAAFFNIVFTYGLETAYFRFFQTEKGNEKVYSTSLISIIASSLTLGLLIVIFSGPLSDLLRMDGNHDTNLALYIAMFAAVLAFDAITAVPFARLRQENKAARFAFLRLVNIGVNILLNVFFLIICPKLVAAGTTNSFIHMIYDPGFGIGYIFTSLIVASAVTLLMLSPEIFRVKLEFDKVLWKKMMIYSFPLAIAGFAGMINETFDRILLPMLIEDKSTAMAQLGIYGACYKLSILMTLFIQTFRYAAEPFFFNHSDKEQSREIYATVMHWFVLVCSFIFLAVMMYIDIVELLIGPEFREGLAVVPILLMANLCLGVFFNLSIWYKLTGKTKWGAWLAIFGAAITLIFNFILIPSMGYMGAAWATLICYASMMAVSYYGNQKYFPVPYKLRPLFGYVFFALLLYFTAEWFRPFAENNLTTILLINTVLTIIFLLTAFLFERRKITYLRSIK